MEKLTFIIPIHTGGDAVRPYVEKACESLRNMEGSEGSEVIVTGCEEGIGMVKEALGDSFDITESVEQDTEFCNLINKAALLVGTKYFSILEFDDYYDEKWLKSFSEYEKYHTDASVYLPIDTLINDKDGEFVGFANEIVWSTSFAEEYGYIDSECLKYYKDFALTGGIIKTDDFITVGGLKPSFSIAAWHEFLMRLCFNGKKGYVIPKYGYNHRVGREGSLMEVKSKEIDPQYVAWLIEQASVECNYREERPLTYNPDDSGDRTSPV